MNYQVSENIPQSTSKPLKASYLVSTLKLKISNHNLQENIKPLGAKDCLKIEMGILSCKDNQSKADVEEQLDLSFHILNLSSADTLHPHGENQVPKKAGYGIGKLLRRVPSFNSRKRYNSPIPVLDVTPKTTCEAAPKIVLEEIVLQDSFNLSSCYQQFKSTNIDDLFSELNPMVDHTGISQGIIPDDFSFNSESISVLSVGEQAADDTSSIGLFDNYKFDQQSCASDLMTAFLETTTPEDKSLCNGDANSKSSSIKSKLIRVFHVINSTKLKDTENSDTGKTLQSSTKDYTPIEMQIPIFRTQSSTIPTIVSDLIEGKESKTSVSGVPISGPSSKSSPDHIKFDQHAKLLVYDANGSCVSKKLEPESPEAQDSPPSYYDLNVDANNGVGEMYILKKSTSSDISLSMKLDNTEVEEDTFHSILKAKINKNAQDEIFRAQCCDFIDIDQFLEIFENNERLRIMQEPVWGQLRQQQIIDYYDALSEESEEFEYDCDANDYNDEINNLVYLS